MFPLVAAVTRESSQEDLSNKTIASIFGPFGSIGLIIAPLAVYLFTSFVVRLRDFNILFEEYFRT